MSATCLSAFFNRNIVSQHSWSIKYLLLISCTVSPTCLVNVHPTPFVVLSPGLWAPRSQHLSEKESWMLAAFMALVIMGTETSNKSSYSHFSQQPAITANLNRKRAGNQNGGKWGYSLFLMLSTYNKSPINITFRLITYSNWNAK